MRPIALALLLASVAACASSGGGTSDDLGAATVVRNTTSIQGVAGQNSIGTGLTSMIH